MSTFEQRTGRARNGKNGHRKEAPAKEAPICNLDAERIVLASFMADNRLFEGYSDKIKASDITEPLLNQAFTIGARLVVENKPANSATIASQITELSPIPDLSVSEYLKKLNPFIRGRDEIGAYVEEVKLASKRRAVLDLAERFQAMARTGGHDIVNQLSSAVALLAGGDDNAGMVHLAPFIEESFQEILRNDDAGWGPTGYLTGFREIDDAIGGLKNSRFYVIAAMEKAGKSALALTIARQLLSNDIPVAIFSLEMKHNEVAQRLIMMELKISVVNRKKGSKLTEDECLRLSEATDRAASWSLYGNDLATLTPAAITMNARHAVRVQGAKVIIIDYIQIVNSEDDERTKDDTRKRVEKASRACARLAKELDVPVIALAQLNRQALGRGAAATFQAFEANACRPRRGDIRETAQIEMDADAIIAIYRPEIIFKQTRPHEGSDMDEIVDFDQRLSKLKGKAELNVLVNRSGPDGVRCDCRYREEIMLFEPLPRKM